MTVSYKAWGRTRTVEFKPGDYAGALAYARKILRDGTARSVTIDI